MSERLTDEHLNELVARAVLTAKDGGCWVDTVTLGCVTNELVDRRLAERRPTPPPIEQGTLRDEFAMDAMREMWKRPTAHLGLSMGGIHGRDHAADACAAYAIADAMLAERAKAKQEPTP